MKLNVFLGICLALGSQLLGASAFAGGKGRPRAVTEKSQTNHDFAKKAERDRDLSVGADRGNPVRTELSSLDSAVVMRRSNGVTWTKGQIKQEKAAVKVFEEMAAEGSADAAVLRDVLLDNHRAAADKALTPEGWQNLMVVAKDMGGRLFRTDEMIQKKLNQLGLEMENFRGCKF